MLSPPEGLTLGDFDQIEAAVLETERGRWFLQEYARRLRATETAEVLAAIERLAPRVSDNFESRRDAAEAMVAMMEALQRLSAFALGAVPRDIDTSKPALPIRLGAAASGEPDRRLTALKELDALDNEAKVKLFG